jgi:hypothetical protein
MPGVNFLMAQFINAARVLRAEMKASLRPPWFFLRQSDMVYIYDQLTQSLSALPTSIFVYMLRRVHTMMLGCGERNSVCNVPCIIVVRTVDSPGA